MRVNKWILGGCLTIAAASVIAIVIGTGSETVTGIGVGLLSGAIVSAVTAALQYSYEWQAICHKVKTVLPGIYTQLFVIKALTGTIVQSAASMDDYSSLDFSMLRILASHCHNIALECDVSGFSGLLKNGRTEKRLARYRQLANELWNLKHCIDKAQIAALQAAKCQLQITLKIQQGQVGTPDEIRQLNEGRNSTIIQLSKIHEYEASLVQKLDELGSVMFSCKNEPWESIKAMANEEAHLILAEANGSVVS